MATEDLKFKATLDDSDLKSGLKSSGDMIGSFAKKAGLAAVALASVDNAAKFATASIEEFKKSEMTIARLGATIKAAGERTAYTSDALQKMATAMQGKSIFGDEAIMDAQRVMLTMQNISDDVIPAAIQAAANMADSEEDLASKAFALGKALESPAEGFTALKRSGVILSDQTEKQIKQLTEEGRLREAQGILLAEIEKRYGGVSDAMAKTAAGQQDILKNKISDEMEKVGESLVWVETGFLKAMAAGASYAAWLFDFENKQLKESRNVYDMEFVLRERNKKQLALYAETFSDLKNSEIESEQKRGEAGIAALQQVEKTMAAEKAAEDKSVKDKQDKADAKAKIASDAATAIADKNKQHWENSFLAGQEMGREELKAQKDLNEQKEALANEAAVAEKRRQDKMDADALARFDEKKRIAQAEQAMRIYVAMSYVGTGSIITNSIMEIAKATTDDAKKQQRIAIAQTLINGAIASGGIWANAMKGWPYTIPGAIASQAQQAAMTTMQVATIAAQKFAQGGIVSGPPSGDTVQIQANGGEMMLNNQQQGNLFRMIQGGGGAGSTINISPVVKVDSGMTAGERDRVAARTADSVRNAIIDLVNAGRLPALA
jgi:hypothetical protein